MNRIILYPTPLVQYMLADFASPRVELAHTSEYSICQLVTSITMKQWCKGVKN